MFQGMNAVMNCAGEVPYSAREGLKASSTDLMTWSSFEEAHEALCTGLYSGVGIVFSSADPFTGIDLDGCVDEDGEVEAWALEIVSHFESYTEFSATGTGLHVIVKGEVPNRRKGGIEVYSSKRFFTITGHVLEVWGVIQDRNEELVAFCAKHFAGAPKKPKTPSNGHHSGLTDEEVLSLIRGAKNAAEFDALWAGDTTAYASPSEADQALISMLAFYTQDDGQLDSLYKRSGLCREKWLKRPAYRRSTIDKALSGLTHTYALSDDGARMVVGNGHVSLPSPSPSLYKEEGRGRKLDAVRFSEMEVPGPRRYLLKDLVLAAYVTLLYGDGGVAKSLLALALSVAVSGGSEYWLGRKVENCPVLYLDFELDAEEQARRVHQLCRGQDLDTPPDNLFYLSALGYSAKEAFASALDACKEHDVGLMVVDSLGPALQGDAEAARDVIGFFQRSIEPFRAEGVAVLIIDHQSRLQAGQSYQSKGAFGSVFKTNLARSVIQAQATERGEGTLTVRLRQKKHNFGPLAEPFGVKLSFSEEAVSLEAIELDVSELAEEATLNATDRVKLALENGPAYPWEIAEHTGLAVKTVKNTLTGLRKQQVVEPTGELENRTEQVQLCVPASLSLYRDGDADDSAPLAGVLVNEQGEAEF